MLAGSWIVTFLALAALGGAATLGAVWVRNYRKDSVNAPEATRKTSRRAVAVVSGAVLSLAIVFVELAGLLGLVGEVFSMFPGGVTQLALAALAIAGFQGWIEIGVVGFSLLVVGVLVASTALTGGSR